MNIIHPTAPTRWATRDEKWHHIRGFPVPYFNEIHDKEGDEFIGPNGHVVSNIKQRAIKTAELEMDDLEGRRVWAGVVENSAREMDRAPGGSKFPCKIWSRVRLRTASCPPPSIWDKETLKRLEAEDEEEKTRKVAEQKVNKADRKEESVPAGLEGVHPSRRPLIKDYKPAPLARKKRSLDTAEAEDRDENRSQMLKKQK
jgi:hypothetical protein